MRKSKSHVCCLKGGRSIYHLYGRFWKKLVSTLESLEIAVLGFNLELLECASHTDEFFDHCLCFRSFHMRDAAEVLVYTLEESTCLVKFGEHLDENLTLSLRDSCIFLSYCEFDRKSR